MGGATRRRNDQVELFYLGDSSTWLCEGFGNDLVRVRAKGMQALSGLISHNSFLIWKVLWD